MGDGRRRSWIFAASVGCAAWSVGSAAAAADVWSDPHPGVRLLRRTTGTPWEISALQIDLCHDGVALRATKSDERQRTVSSFAQLVGAEAAINGDFFSYESYGTSGLAIGAGERWGDTADTSGSGFIAFGRGRAEVWPPATVLDDPEPWMREVVSGRRPLVDDGVPYATDEGELCTTRHPRTAAGLSEDGRTLILVVVDGRSSASVGMRCTELAALMVELGAHDASNLDGGGSSTLWVAGEGVVNVPSDGAQRTVANHLGVLATGTGEPGSCDRSPEEAGLHGDAYGASTSSDIDGDGVADLCARAGAGIRCRLAADDFAADVIGPTWSDAQGWDDPSNYATIRSGDIDGDGRADLCARADAGIVCQTSVTGLLADPVSGPALDDAAGFDAPERYATIRLADVDGDGRDDLCAMTDDGFACWRSTGEGFGAEPWRIADLAEASGFARPSHYGTLRTGDVDGDGRADVCARRSDGVACWPAGPDGFGEAIPGPPWSDDAGWDRVEYWSTLRLVDVDGDRRADLCARAADGLRCHLAEDDGFGEAILGPTWSDESGWWDYANYSTIRFGDLDGDGDTDVCARANAGLRCAAWDGDAFGETFAGPSLADDQGWGSIRFFSTLRLVDVDGDARADVCARAGAGVRCWSSTGDGFATDPIVGPGWSDDGGWAAPAYYETLRASTAVPRCYVDERCDDGVDDDCDGEIDEGCSAGDTTSGGPADGSSDGGAGTEEGSSAATDGGDSSDGAGALPTTFGEAGDEAGCSCTAGGRPGAWWWMLLAIAWRRRNARRG